MTRVNVPGKSSVRRCRAAVERLERRDLCAATQTAYVQTYLTSNLSGATPIVDANLVDAWGLAPTPDGKLLVASNGSGVATEYDAGGNQVPSATAPLVVTIPPAASTTGKATPTGVVLNTSKSFSISSNGHSGVATYLFATEDGTIAGYNASVNATAAVTMVDASASSAVYKGLAVVGSGKSAQILAANFRTAQVDVYDSKLNLVSSAARFRDESIPVGYAPFNVQLIANKVYVTYAKQDANKLFDVAGSGNGYVDVYSTRGILMQRLAPPSQSLGGTGPFNAPWGIVKAPAGFGSLAGDILVGNFGDGSIQAFNKAGAHVAEMQVTGGGPLTLQGLWGLAFGTGTHRHTLYAASGPNAGSYGALASVTLPAKVKKHA